MSVSEAAKKKTADKKAQIEARKKKATAPMPPSSKPVANKEAVWSAVHYYMQPSSSWDSVQRDARDERKFRSVAVLVFAHHHAFGVACDNSCKEYENENGC